MLDNSYIQSANTKFNQHKDILNKPRTTKESISKQKSTLANINLDKDHKCSKITNSQNILNSHHQQINDLSNASDIHVDVLDDQINFTQNKNDNDILLDHPNLEQSSLKNSVPKITDEMDSVQSNNHENLNIDMHHKHDLSKSVVSDSVPKIENMANLDLPDFNIKDYEDDLNVDLS